MVFQFLLVGGLLPAAMTGKPSGEATLGNAVIGNIAFFAFAWSRMKRR